MSQRELAEKLNLSEEMVRAKILKSGSKRELKIIEEKILNTTYKETIVRRVTESIRYLSSNIEAIGLRLSKE